MKKNLVNKKVVSSIGIGIMAFVTATSPVLTVLAEENDAGPVLGDGDISGEQMPGGENTIEGELSSATEAVNNAHTENAGIKSEIDKTNETYTSENKGQSSISDEKVSENLGNSQKALEELKEESKDLDKLKAEADIANQALKEALDHANEGIDKEFSDVEKAIESVGDLEKVTTDEIVNNTKETANNIENAQKQTYENAAAAQVAKEQALAEAAEAQMAKEAALNQQAEAETALRNAEASLEVLERDTAAAKEKYEEAVKAVGEANIKLVEMLGEFGLTKKDLVVDEETGKLQLEDNMSEPVKKALQSAWEALEQAKADYEKAGNEFDTAKTAQGEAQEIYEEQSKRLDAATTTLKAYENWDDARKELRQAQQEVLAKTVEEQENKCGEAATAYQNAKNDLNLIGKDKRVQEARDAYIAQTDAQATAMIKYQLLERGVIDDLDDAEFGKWVSTRGDNNYFVVSYPKKDEKGNICIDEEGNVIYEYEYYDYTEDVAEGGVTELLKKEIADGEVVYECGDKDKETSQLEIKTDANGDPEFYLWGARIDDTYSVEGNMKIGYTVKDPNGNSVDIEKAELTFYYWEEFKRKELPVTTVTISGKTIYLIDGKDVTETVKFRVAGLTIEEINGIKVTDGVIEKKKSNIKGTEIVFGPQFKDKGSIVSVNTSMSLTEKAEDELQRGVKEAKDKTKDAKDEVDKVKVQWIEEANGEGNVRDYLGTFKGEQESYVKELFIKLEAAKEEAETKEKRKDIANEVNSKVDNAYKNVVTAIKELYELRESAVQNEDEWEKLKEKCEKAVEEYKEALKAKGLSDAKCIDIEGAANRAIEAANKDFAYRTSTTTPTGGTTGGGTGGTTGGGTGGAGGGAADAAVSAAAPVVTIPTAAVPLAGPAVADAEEAVDGAAGLTTLEDEVTPLAGPEKKEDAAGLADFPIPDINIAAEARQMSWLWLLIVALLGATGIEMYRRHQKKQQEEANIEN